MIRLRGPRRDWLVFIPRDGSVTTAKQFPDTPRFGLVLFALSDPETDLPSVKAWSTSDPQPPDTTALHVEPLPKLPERPVESCGETRAVPVML